MSYILDALKKSERERPPGTIPDLFTVHGPQSQPPSPRWPTRAIVAVSLLLAVPAIGLLAWIGTGRRDESAVRPPVAASPQPRAEDPPAPPRTDAAPTLPAPARIVAAARRPLGERQQPPALPRQRSRGAIAPAVVPTPGPAATPTPAEPAPASVPAVPVSLAPALVIAAPSDIPLPTEAEHSAPTAPVPAASTADSEVTPPADGRVLDLAELPAPIRAELPKLLVSGHVWSEEPSLRLLSTDDRLLREGGEAAPGVSLQEITPEGAVFVFKGWRFRVAGGRP